MANLSAQKCGKLFLFCHKNVYLISQMKTAIEHNTPVQPSRCQAVDYIFIIWSRLQENYGTGCGSYSYCTIDCSLLLGSI